MSDVSIASASLNFIDFLSFFKVKTATVRSLQKPSGRSLINCFNCFSPAVLHESTFISLVESFPERMRTISCGWPSTEKGAIDVTRHFLSLSQSVLSIFIHILGSSLWWVSFLFVSFPLNPRRLCSTTLETCKHLAQRSNALSFRVIPIILAGP